jgi:hypothetical protein
MANEEQVSLSETRVNPFHPRYGKWPIHLQGADLNLYLLEVSWNRLASAICKWTRSNNEGVENEHYTGCPRRNRPNFSRVFLKSNYTDITQNTYIQSSMVTEILAREV